MLCEEEIIGSVLWKGKFRMSGRACLFETNFRIQGSGLPLCDFLLSHGLLPF